MTELVAADGSEPIPSDGHTEGDVIEIDRGEPYAPIAYVDLDYAWCSGNKGSYWARNGRI